MEVDHEPKNDIFLLIHHPYFKPKTVESTFFEYCLVFAIFKPLPLLVEARNNSFDSTLNLKSDKLYFCRLEVLV